MKWKSIVSRNVSFISVQPVLLFFIAVFFTGCGPIYYAPNTQNVPIMKEKGQINLSMGLNATEYTDGFELQGAYGLTNRWALLLNADWVDSSEFGSSGSGNIVEIGGGYYKSLSPSFVFETYGLVGQGSLEYHDNSIENNGINANFYRIGVQPSISFSKKYFSTSLSSRLATIRYTRVHGNLIYDVDYLKTHDSQWLLEPALTFQGGLENIKLQLQFQLSYNLTDPDFIQDYTLISLGLKINLVPKKVKK